MRTLFSSFCECACVGVRACVFAARGAACVWAQNLEGSPASVQARVRSAFSELLHALASTLERCFVTTGDTALATAVMRTAALDFEHSDHGLLLEAGLVPILGKVALDSREDGLVGPPPTGSEASAVCSPRAGAGVSSGSGDGAGGAGRPIPWHEWVTVPPGVIKRCLKDGTLSKLHVLQYMKVRRRTVLVSSVLATALQWCF
jgi:hypothetical protein